MPCFVAFRAPIGVVAQLNLNVRSGVLVVGEGWRGDGLEQEIRFHPRRTVLHGKVGGNGCTAGRSGVVRGVHRELRAVGGAQCFGHAAIITGTKRRDDKREVARIALRSILRQSGDVQGQGSVAR